MFLLNIILIKSDYITFKLSSSNKNGDLNPLTINDTSITEEEKNCKYWIPSLFSPTLLVYSEFNSTGKENLKREFEIYPPFLSRIALNVNLFKIDNLLNNYNLILSKIRYDKTVKECYFGLSKNGNYSGLIESEINLNMLKNADKIKQQIFSFDKWDIKNNDLITTNLYLGDVHENFVSHNGIIGNCSVDDEDFFWGCSFKKMNFNNNIIELNKENGSNYKIYFSSENHKIVFPLSFRDKFNEKTNNVCKEDTISEEEITKGLSCKNLFDPSKNYIPLKLIDDSMIITTEIDNLYRFNSDNIELVSKTRIIFENVDYFILPLIMFKNFHVQFDLNNNIISFFTTDKSILELISKEEDNSQSPEENKDSSSNIGTIFLIIFIIILILVLGFGVFWFIKKRKSSEKNINKYNKFEDEENFQNMNEKVF
jgi:hypothetical protein